VFKALLKEGSGNNFMALAWEYNGRALEVIPARFSQIAAPARNESCGVTLDTWKEIGGNTISELIVGTNNFTKAPDSTTRLTNKLEVSSYVGDNYGIRIKGWLRPPVTANFVFWIASYNEGEFWLSTDSDPKNKKRVCHQRDRAPPPGRQWRKYPEQRSMPIPLVAGQMYYYEVRYCVAFTS
jgi:hypothetical protein